MNNLSLIFILGNSHSGSTLISFLLGADPAIFYLGEVKLKTVNQPDYGDCTCGKTFHDCPFWSQIHRQSESLKNVLWSAREKRNFFLGVQFNHDLKINNNTREKMTELLGLYSQQVSSVDPDARYFLDSSKSLWMLHLWRQVPGVELKVIWVKRSYGGNVYSFMKRKRPFLKSLLGLKLNDFLIEKYLCRNNIEHFTLHHDSLSDYYQEEFGRIGLFLGLNRPVKVLPGKEYHVLTGNKGTRDQFIEGFSGFRKDDQWERKLWWWQKLMVDLVS